MKITGQKNHLWGQIWYQTSVPNFPPKLKTLLKTRVSSISYTVYDILYITVHTVYHLNKLNIFYLLESLVSGAEIFIKVILLYIIMYYINILLYYIQNFPNLFNHARPIVLHLEHNF